MWPSSMVFQNLLYLEYQCVSWLAGNSPSYIPLICRFSHSTWGCHCQSLFARGIYLDVDFRIFGHILFMIVQSEADVEFTQFSEVNQTFAKCCLVVEFTHMADRVDLHSLDMHTCPFLVVICLAPACLCTQMNTAYNDQWLYWYIQTIKYVLYNYGDTHAHMPSAMFFPPMDCAHVSMHTHDAASIGGTSSHS